MKFAFCLLAFIVTCQAISEEEELQKWSEYQIQFGKSYRSPVEHRHRFALFREKLREIEEHNKLYADKKISWYKGLTPFSDWTKEEFKIFVNKYTFEEPNDDEELFDSTNLTVPASIDWRSKGAVAEVKNQGTCGSCWTFSSTGALEGAVKIQTGVLMSLSEQNLLDCAGDYYHVRGCTGGTTIGAFSYARDHGITTESAYPYTGTKGVCRNVRPVVYVKDIVRVPADENELIKAVGSVGPVSVAVFASDALSDYAGGIFDDASCAGVQGVNHGVLAVGYGSENGKDYWIMKNSWGAGWGESGYWRMIRGKNSCNVNAQSRYARV